MNRRALFILLAFLTFATLGLSQTRYTGCGPGMEPTLQDHTALVVYEATLASVRIGDIVARRIDSSPYLIGTRVISLTERGFITRADVKGALDDAGYLTESDYLGKVFLDSAYRARRLDNDHAAYPWVRNLYVLTLYVDPIQVRAAQRVTIPPTPPVDKVFIVDPPPPGWNPPTSSVPDAAPTGILLMVSLLGLIALRRRFRP